MDTGKVLPYLRHLLWIIPVLLVLRWCLSSQKNIQPNQQKTAATYERHNTTVSQPPHPTPALYPPQTYHYGQPRPPHGSNQPAAAYPQHTPMPYQQPALPPAYPQYGGYPSPYQWQQPVQPQYRPLTEQEKARQQAAQPYLPYR